VFHARLAADRGIAVSRDTSFYYSFLVLPPRKRRAIIAVWDFCRAVDDAVDEAPEGANVHERLSLWRDELAACYAPSGDGPDTPQGRALQPYIRDFNLPRRPFEDLIDGVEMDLAHARYQTFAELAGYCRRVASAVGLVCVEIFGYHDASARAYAVDLGMALQLTNIIRDVSADLAQGRIYLPAEDMARFRVTGEDLRAGRMTPAVSSLMRFECERARFYYTKAAATLPPADRRNLLAAEIMGAIYFEILRRIEQSGYDVFTRRIRVPRLYRAVTAIRLWTRALFSR
jgi:phytoene synthase